jgi:RHS repeat-associated protein
MAGISSKAANVQENRFKYNTWERNQDLEIEIDESFYRSNDYQTGRFLQVDPKTENMEMWSPYALNYDNPIRFNDPKGDQPGCCDGDPIVAIGQLAKDFFDNGVVPAVAWINRNLNPVYGVANGTKVLATGTNFDGQQQSAASGVTEIGFALVPGASLEKVSFKQAEKVVVKTATGTEIKGFTKHGVDRAIERGVKPASIKDAIKNPLKTGQVITDKLGRQSQRYVGKTAEVVVNPETGKIISVNPTSTKKAAKLLKKAGGE